MNLDKALATIREIPDFPIPGVLFRDITPLLSNPEAFATVISALSESSDNYQAVAGIEARGFILGAALAHKKEVAFVPLRKGGKLPYATHARSYGLEYGEDVIEVHTDAFIPGQGVLLIDDVLATGGTLAAGIELIRDCGAEVSGVAVLLEIGALGGREKLLKEFPDISIHALSVI
jgi:adenine phosphoribosyltransferase